MQPQEAGSVANVTVRAGRETPLHLWFLFQSDRRTAGERIIGVSRCMKRIVDRMAAGITLVADPHEVVVTVFNGDRGTEEGYGIHKEQTGRIVVEHVHPVPDAAFELTGQLDAPGRAGRRGVHAHVHAAVKATSHSNRLEPARFGRFTWRTGKAILRHNPDAVVSGSQVPELVETGHRRVGSAADKCRRSRSGGANVGVGTRYVVRRRRRNNRRNSTTTRINIYRAGMYATDLIRWIGVWLVPAQDCGVRLAEFSGYTGADQRSWCCRQIGACFANSGGGVIELDGPALPEPVLVFIPDTITHIGGRTEMVVVYRAHEVTLTGGDILDLEVAKVVEGHPADSPVHRIVGGPIRYR